jgi:hypothetical protein
MTDIIEKAKPEIRIEFIDLQGKVTAIHGLAEARAWNWNEPGVVKMIDGVSIRSWDELVQFVQRKLGEGDEEITVYESPDPTLLGGG